MSEKVKIYNLIVLDRSSSMNSVRSVTISGLNEQLQSIRKSQEDYPDQEQILCFATFSDNVDCDSRWNKSISEVEDFTENDYKPHGMTALNDAVGVSITKLRNEIREDLEDRKANVMVSIFTDGDENVSKEFTSETAKMLVEEVKKTGMWTVSFIGCGNDVFEVAASYGINRGDTLSYSAGTVGTQQAFETMSQSRSLRSAAYSQIYCRGMDVDSISQNLNALNNAGNFFDNLDIDSTKEEDEDKKIS